MIRFVIAALTSIVAAHYVDANESASRTVICRPFRSFGSYNAIYVKIEVDDATKTSPKNSDKFPGDYVDIFGDHFHLNNDCVLVAVDKANENDEIYSSGGIRGASPQIDDGEILESGPEIPGNTIGIVGKNRQLFNRFACHPGHQPKRGFFAFGCDPCPEGTHKDAVGSFDCWECPVGYFNTGTGNYMCFPCPPGHVQPQTRQNRCNECPEGTEVNWGRQTCDPRPTASPETSSPAANRPTTGSNTAPISTGDVLSKINLNQVYTAIDNGSNWEDARLMVGGLTSRIVASQIQPFFEAHQANRRRQLQMGTVTIADSDTTVEPSECPNSTLGVSTCVKFFVVVSLTAMGEIDAEELQDFLQSNVDFVAEVNRETGDELNVIEATTAVTVQLELSPEQPQHEEEQESNEATSQETSPEQPQHEEEQESNPSPEEKETSPQQSQHEDEQESNEDPSPGENEFVVAVEPQDPEPDPGVPPAQRPAAFAFGEYSGNPHCVSGGSDASFGFDYGWKMEDCQSGTFVLDTVPFSGGGEIWGSCATAGSVSIDVTCNDDKSATISWTGEGVSLVAIKVKGGPGGVLYDTIQRREGTFFAGPNGSGKGVSGISHIEVCVQCENCGEVPPGGSCQGDPHFRSWSGDSWDYHGECDMVFLQHSSFANGLGLHIHIRTKITTWWSFIQAAVIWIGEDSLEVVGGKEDLHYWLNGQGPQEFVDGTVASLSDFPITFYRRRNNTSHVDIDLGDGDTIVFSNFIGFLQVKVIPKTFNKFTGSVGLLGSFPHGKKLGRNQTKLIVDPNEFGQEWQVLESEPILFHNNKGDVAVQAPMKCVLPDDNERTTSRRRLGESLLREEDIALACANVSPENQRDCIFDVEATQDTAMAGAYV